MEERPRLTRKRGARTWGTRTHSKTEIGDRRTKVKGKSRRGAGAPTYPALRDDPALRQKKLNFGAFGQGGHAVGGAECQRHDGHGWLAAAGGDETAAVAKEKIRDVMGAMVGIDDGGLRVIAHAAGSEQVDGEILLGDGVSPFLLRTGSIEDFEGASVQELLKLEVIRMILVGHAHGGKSVIVLQGRV